MTLPRFFRWSSMLLLTALMCQCASPPAASPAPPAAVASWNRVTTRLAAAVPADHDGRPIQWRFSVRPTSGSNACSWPDGRVEITSGTLSFVRNEAELAAVAAHEMAHVFRRHGRQRALETGAVLLGGAALGAVLATQDGDTVTAAGVASGAVLTFSLTALAARQREQEFEADRLSLDLMRRAGYAPGSAVSFWERYAAARARHGLGQGGWWKAHPPDAARVHLLRQLAVSR